MLINYVERDLKVLKIGQNLHTNKEDAYKYYQLSDSSPGVVSYMHAVWMTFHAHFLSVVLIQFQILYK